MLVIEDAHLAAGAANRLLVIVLLRARGNGDDGICIAGASHPSRNADAHQIQRLRQLIAQE